MAIEYYPGLSFVMGFGLGMLDISVRVQGTVLASVAVLSLKRRMLLDSPSIKLSTIAEAIRYSASHVFECYGGVLAGAIIRDLSLDSFRVRENPLFPISIAALSTILPTYGNSLLRLTN